MALSLTLVFERHNPLREAIRAFNKLDFGDVPADFVDVLSPMCVPLEEGVEWPDDETGLTLHKTDPYGDPLTFISAALLHPRLPEVADCPWSEAIVAFVKALPPATRVVLWWH